MAKQEFFITYGRQLVVRLRAMHKPVAEKYRTSLNQLSLFRNHQDIPFAEFTSPLMLAFESWLRKRVVRNTSSFYLRNLHAIYNKAMDENIAAEDRNPFHHVYTGVERTAKRAIGLQDIKRIRECDLQNNRSLAIARDMFLFAFYTRGMSFIDMAYLKKSNLNGDRLTYRRSKTMQAITMRWTQEMETIVRRYSTCCHGDYLLPILTETDYEASRRQYSTASHRLNRHLKLLGQQLSLGAPLTMYVARHSWATAAQEKGVPIHIISRGLGHDSERTTRIYLASMDTSQVDEANEMILRALK